MDTRDLIDSLAENVKPVRRLLPPMLRATLWLGLAVVVLLALVMLKGLRPAFFDRMQDMTFAMGLTASVLTGVLAATAAVLASLPDRSRLWLLLPLPPAAVWLSTMGYQCLAGWVPVDPRTLTMHVASDCMGTLILASMPLSIAMLAMVRHAGVLRSRGAIMMGGLAVAAITTAALNMVHPMDATLMIIGWNLGTAALFVGAAALFDAVTGRTGWRRRIGR